MASRITSPLNKVKIHFVLKTHFNSHFNSKKLAKNGSLLCRKLLLTLLALPVLTFAEFETELQTMTGLICSDDYKTITTMPTFNLDGRSLVSLSTQPNSLDDNYGLSASYVHPTCPMEFWGHYSLDSLEYTIAGNRLTPDVEFSGFVLENMGYNCCYFTHEMQLAYYTSVSDQIKVNAINYDALSKVVSMQIPGTNWADIHLKINNAGQLNYRMMKQNNAAIDTYSQPLTMPLKAGDQISFTVTAERTSNARAADSAVYGFNIVSVPEEFGWGFASENRIGFYERPNFDMDWVDVHYSNAYGSFNHRMVKLNEENSFYHSVAEFALGVPGEPMSLWFTYSINGSAKNSEIIYLAN